jgi:hypothetical protein
MGILLLAIPVVFWKARKTRSTAYTLLGLSLLVSVLPLAWFFPFALRLYEWMFQAALGDGARSMHADFLPLTANLWALLQSSGSFVILAAAAILALSLLAREDFRRFLTVASDDRRRATAYLVVSMALPLGIIVLGSSVSPAFSASGQAWRRLLASFCVLILTCMLVGLRQGMPLRLLRVTALALLLTQSAVAAIRNGALDWPIARYKAFSGELEKPVRLIPEPNGQVIAALDRLALTEDVTRVNIEGYTDISAGALRLLANIQEKKYIVGNDYIPAYAGPQQVPELARRFSHIVIAMKPPLGDAPNEIQTRITEYRAKADANSHRQADILQFLSSGWLEHYGLQYVSRMQEARSEAFIFRSLLYGRTADGTPIATFPHADVEYITKKPPKGAVATATSSQAGFPVSNLIDGTPTPWGAVETADDTYFGLVFDTPRTVKEIRMVMFSSGGLQHLRDVSVVVSDAAQPNGANWRVIRSRLEGQKDFTEKVTVPPLPDQAVVRLEIDPSEPAPHRAWGLACLSKSKNYVRNYLQAGTGVYVRELEMK